MRKQKYNKTGSLSYQIITYSRLIFFIFIFVQKFIKLSNYHTYKIWRMWLILKPMFIKLSNHHISKMTWFIVETSPMFFSYQTCYTLKNTIDCLYIVEQVRLVIKLPFFQNLHLLPHTESLIHNVSKATLSRLVAHLKIFLKLSNYNTFKIKLRNY